MKYTPLSLLLFAGLWLPLTAPRASSAEPLADLRGQEAAAAEPAERGLTPLLANVRLIGASITAGYGNGAELKLGRNVPLANFLGSALAQHNADAQLKGNGDSLFYRSPVSRGASQVRTAKAASPSLVIGLDFLFWYGFGRDRLKSPRRMTGLEQGLKELETLECPLVIGTLPNVEHALRGKGPLGGPVIVRSQFPTEAERAAMNERILAWAAERDNVEVVDVDGMFRTIVAREPLVLRGQELKIEALQDVLNEDLLHLNLRGYAWTALAVGDAIARMQGASDDDFVLNRAAIEERFLESIQEAQAKQAERVAKRLARKAAREAKRQEKVIR